MRRLLLSLALLAAAVQAPGGERSIVSLKDLGSAEVRSAGIQISRGLPVHIRAVGAGAAKKLTYKSDRLFAYGWIIRADDRSLVWAMDRNNSTITGDDRVFDGTINLPAGAYEVYFTVPVFDYHTTFTHFSNVNVDHRSKPLFGPPDKQNPVVKFFRSWWTDDLQEAWEEASPRWGLEMFVDESVASAVQPFAPPREDPGVLLTVSGEGDNAFVRKAFALAEPLRVRVVAQGESMGDDRMADGAWIVSQADRRLVWEMRPSSCGPAGGAGKNTLCRSELDLGKGEYVLYWMSDDSHSEADWNDLPPYDPLRYGVVLAAATAGGAGGFRPVPYDEYRNTIVSIVKPGNSASRSEGFALKENTAVRVYAFGERNIARRSLADYGVIIDAKTRQRVWTMDVDRVRHGGGAAKNCFVDEIIDLPAGNYIVSYLTDDSHTYNDWNDAPPFDPEHYGITLMGWGPGFTAASVGKFVQERDKNIIAQIARPGNDVDQTEKFTLDKTTRVRVYAVGEGQNREMYDYAWIEDARSGNVVWEMTYAMTFHAGGGRKNRVVNSTILLDRGAYRLRYRSDDSHSYGNWNTEQPEDAEFWGVTLYRAETAEAPLPPKAPAAPKPGKAPPPPAKPDDE